jgi:hypothetical protein
MAKKILSEKNAGKINLIFKKLPLKALPGMEDALVN